MTEDIRRLTRRQLYDLVWKTPVDTLAKNFGMSGRGLGKLCERHGIPVPPRGYWARKASGQKMRRPPLVEFSDSEHPEIVLDLRFRTSTHMTDANASETALSPHRELFERQLRKIGAVRVSPQLREPHPVIAAWLRKEERLAQNSLLGRGYFQAKYETPLARRRLRILNALFQELERRGCKIGEDASRRHDFTILLARDSLDFTLSESVRQIRRRLTEAEKAERHHSSQEWTQFKEPTGKLFLKLSSNMPKGVPQSWQDEEGKPLENHLPEILAGIFTGLAHARAQRESKEAEERRRWAREEKERRLEAERQAELDRKLGLRQRVKAWQVAAQIREYVAAVEDAAKKGGISVEPGDLEEWKKWALAHADDIDPLRRGNAMKTSLLWNEERPTNSEYGLAHHGGRAGDPNWFWGRRWWLK